MKLAAKEARKTRELQRIMHDFRIKLEGNLFE